jgi:hypothetical protein
MTSCPYQACMYWWWYEAPHMSSCPYRAGTGMSLGICLRSHQTGSAFWYQSRTVPVYTPSFPPGTSRILTTDHPSKCHPRT